MIDSASTNKPTVQIGAIHSRVSSAGRKEAPTVGLWVTGVGLFFLIVKLGNMYLVPQNTSGEFLFGSIGTLGGIITIYFTSVLQLAITIILAIVVHEGAHGLAYLLLGYTPNLTRGQFTVAVNELPHREMVFVKLAGCIAGSFIFLPLIFLPGIGAFALIAFAGNFAGSLDDIWSAAQAVSQVSV